MNLERTGLAAAIIVVFMVLAVAFIGSITGNIVQDSGSVSSPLVGLVIMIFMVIAGYFVSRSFVSESRFHQ